ncbi:MAG: twin-arginine translocase subunit TatC [Phycisphaerae bacterium]|nr:twin-arginine translocase subunit TatC [Phycisphaerae bacterium]
MGEPEEKQAIRRVERLTEPADEVRMSFGDHLEELRRRVLYAVLGLAVTVAASFWFAENVVAFLCQPLLVALRMAGEPARLYQEKVPQLFVNYMEMALLAGVILGSPWIIYQFWQFIGAGLYQRERRFVKHYGAFSLGLFLTGAAFVYFLAMPFALKYFVEFSRGFKAPEAKYLTPIQRGIYGEELKGFEKAATSQPDAPLIPRLAEAPPARQPTPMWIDADTNEVRFYDPDGHVWALTAKKIEGRESLVAPWFNLDEYLSFMISMMLVFGVGFQMPLVILFLAASGLVPTATLRKRRRIVILLITIAAAVITPTPDALSMCMLALPMWGLFELGLLLGARAERKRAAEAE